MQKSTKEKLLIILSFFVPLITVFVYFYVRYVNIKEGLNDFISKSIELRGVVTDLKSVNKPRNGGLLYVDVISTNVIEYDSRKNNRVYYGLIKDKKLELTEPNLNYYSIGDTITVISKELMVVNETKNKAHKIHITPLVETDFFEEIRKNHRIE